MNPEDIDPAKQAAAGAIGDQAKIILAGMLPSCAARRYDLPDPPGWRWGVDLCFADRGPIVPTLQMSHNPPYFTLIGLSVYYMLMLQDPFHLALGFPGPVINCVIPLDGGPRKVADGMCQAVAKIDLATMVAAGAIERIYAESPRYPVPWPNFLLAKCAIYLRKYDEARELLQNALHYADKKGRQYYGSLGLEAETCLSKLNADADLLRREIMATLDYNWAHFKIVNG
jgi:hypothetical protein